MRDPLSMASLLMFAMLISIQLSASSYSNEFSIVSSNLIDVDFTIVDTEVLSQPKIENNFAVLFEATPIASSVKCPLLLVSDESSALKFLVITTGDRSSLDKSSESFGMDDGHSIISRVNNKIDFTGTLCNHHDYMFYQNIT